MLISKRRSLSDRYRPLFLGLLILFSYAAAGQATYNPAQPPGMYQTLNKPIGSGQAFATDARSLKADSVNLLYRLYNGTSEVLSYLSVSKYRYGFFPIYVNVGGALQSNGTYIGGITEVYFFRNGTADSNLVRWYTDSLNLVGAPFYSVANNLSEGNAGLIKGNLALDLVNNTSDAQKNAATVSLTNHTIDGNNNTLLHIPNSALTNNSIGLTITSSVASDIVATTTPAALGSNLVLNIPTAGSSSRGALNAANWNFFNGKLDSIHISNDSVYNCVNGTCTLQSVLAGAGGVNSVNGTNASVLVSPSTGNVLLQVNPAFNFNWSGQHTFASFAPIFSTLTTAGGVFYGDGSGQLLQSPAGTSGQIFESQAGAGPIFFTPNAATVNGWLGYTALSNALGSTHLFVGNGSNVATDVALTGDASILNTGALTNTGLKGVTIPSLSPGNLKYNGTSWIFDNNTYKLLGVDTIYRTVGKDSIQFTINGRYHSILDSASGGTSQNLQQTLTAGNTSTLQMKLTTDTGFFFAANPKMLLVGDSILSSLDSIIALGDSWTFGTGPSFTTNGYAYLYPPLYGCTVWNRGVNGRTLISSGGGNSLMENIAQIPVYSSTGNYKLISVMIGVNDAALGASPSVFTTTYEAYLDSIIVEKGWPVAKIVVLPPGYNNGIGHTNITSIVAACQTAATAMGVQYVDVFDYMKNYPGGESQLMNADSLHPNDLGSRVVVQAIAHGLTGISFAGNATVNGILVVNKSDTLKGTSTFQGPEFHDSTINNLGGNGGTGTGIAKPNLRIQFGRNLSTFYTYPVIFTANTLDAAQTFQDSFQIAMYSNGGHPEIHWLKNGTPFVKYLNGGGVAYDGAAQAGWGYTFNNTNGMYITDGMLIKNGAGKGMALGDGTSSFQEFWFNTSAGGLGWMAWKLAGSVQNSIRMSATGTYAGGSGVSSGRQMVIYDEVKGVNVGNLQDSGDVFTWGSSKTSYSLQIFQPAAFLTGALGTQIRASGKIHYGYHPSYTWSTSAGDSLWTPPLAVIDSFVRAQVAGAATNPFSDANPLVKNSGDATKQLRFDLSGQTTGKTNIWHFTNATNATVARTDSAQTFSGDQSYSGNVIVIKHLLGNNTPSIAAGTGAGSSPTVSITGSDQAGLINVTTGTLPSASSTVATITFSVAFPNGSYPVLYPANAPTAALSGTSMVFTAGATGNFTITSGTLALGAATGYQWYYYVGGN